MIDSDVALLRPSVRASALIVVGGALLSGPVAVVLVVAVAPQPAWQGVDLFVQSYHAVQMLPYLFGFVLLFGFVGFVASCHAAAMPAHRARTTAALVFTAVYASLVFANYTIQVGYVPRSIAAGGGDLAAWTMANPGSFAWFLEMFGYAALGVATWLVSEGFGGGSRGRLIRALLVVNGVVSVIGAACTAAFDGWVFSTAGLVSFVAWNVLIVLCFLLIAMTPDGGYVRQEPATRG